MSENYFTNLPWFISILKKDVIFFLTNYFLYRVGRVPFDEPPMEFDPIPKTSPDDLNVGMEQNKEKKETAPTPASNDSADTPPVILEEMALPRMFIPGKIVHIYTHNGGYKAACVPRTFRELRRVSLAGNMLSDHTCKSYYEAMLEVRSIRKASKKLPKWTSFGEDSTWYVSYLISSIFRTIHNSIQLTFFSIHFQFMLC